MHYLVHGVVATGVGAFHPGQTPSLSSDGESSSDTGSDGSVQPPASPITEENHDVLNDNTAREVMEPMVLLLFYCCSAPTDRKI